MNPMLRPELDVRSGDGSRQRVMITCVPQTKTKTYRPNRQKGRRKKKEDSMFVTLLIIFHTLQIGVYCIGGRGWGIG